MKRLLAALALTAAAAYGQIQQQPSQARLNGTIYAYGYATWSAPEGTSPTSGGVTWTSPLPCTAQSGGISFPAFTVGTAIKIVDNDPSLTETATVTYVQRTQSSCTIQASMANTHLSYSIESATAGLQEALNSNLNDPSPNTVVLTNAWFTAGGTPDMITAAKGNSLLQIVDVTKSPFNWYTWTGSAYVLVPVGGGGSVTDFSASPSAWPAWLTPSVTNPTTTPALSVTAGQIPNSALVNSSITLGTTQIALGDTVDNALGFNAATASALAATPSLCALGQAPLGILANGNATDCAILSSAVTGWGGSLTAAQGSADTTASVDVEVGTLPPSGYFPIDSEWEYFASATSLGSGDYTLNGILRGQFATTAASHSDSASIPESMVQPLGPPSGSNFAWIGGAAGDNFLSINCPLGQSLDSTNTFQVGCNGAGFAVNNSGQTLLNGGNGYLYPGLSFYLGYQPSGANSLNGQEPLTNGYAVLQNDFPNAVSSNISFTAGIPGGVKSTQAPSAPAPVLFNDFVPSGSTTYTYGCQGADELGGNIPATNASLTNLSATITAGSISVQCLIPGAVSWELFRTAGGGSTGVIASGSGAFVNVSDNGLTGDSSSENASNTTISHVCTNGLQYCVLSGTTTTPPLACSPSGSVPTAGWTYNDTTAPSSYTCNGGTSTWTLNGGGGGMVYPGAGVANSTGSAWGTSYTVGNSGSDIPQLSSGLLSASVLPEATSSTFGAVKPDNSTITISGGIISSSGGGGGLPSASTGQMITNSSGSTTYGPQANVFYQQSSDTVASIEAACSSLCIYHVTFPQTITLTANHTMNSNVWVEFDGDGIWTVNGSGYTLSNLQVSSASAPTVILSTAGTASVQFSPLTKLPPIQWFGAVNNATNSGSGTDSTAAIQACLNAVEGGQCYVPAGAYKTSAALTVTRSNVGLKGATAGFGFISGFPSSPSLIISNCASCDIVDVGTSSAIGYNQFDHLALQRSVTPSGTSAGLSLNDVAGYTVDQLQSFDSVHPIYVTNAPSYGTGYIRDSDISWASTGLSYTGTSLTMCGVYVDSTTGNPSDSIRVENVSAGAGSLGGGGSVADGVCLNGYALNDFFGTKIQGNAGLRYGMNVTYSGSGTNFSAGDIYCWMCVMDSYNTSAYYISGLSAAAGGNMEITGGWASSNVSTSPAIQIVNSQGVTVSNVQIGGDSSTYLATLTGSTHNTFTGNFFGTINGTATKGISADSASTGNHLYPNNYTSTITTQVTDATVNGNPTNMGVLQGVLGSGETVAYSATPTFSNITRKSLITLTGSVTSFTLPAGIDGQEKTLEFCQNGTGGYTVAAPSSVLGFFTVGTTANTCSAQHYTYDATTQAWLADSPGVTNMATAYQDYATFAGSSGTLLSAYTTTASKTFALYSGNGTATVIPQLNGSSSTILPSGTDMTYGDSLDTLTPSSANYAVGITCTRVAGSPTMGVFARAASGSNTNYAFQFDPGGPYLDLYAQYSGTFTLVGNYSFTWANGATHTLVLGVNGTSISASVDGTPITGSPFTDSHVAAAGQAGLRITGGSDATCTNFYIQ